MKNGKINYYKYSIVQHKRNTSNSFDNAPLTTLRSVVLHIVIAALMSLVGKLRLAPTVSYKILYTTTAGS